MHTNILTNDKYISDYKKVYINNTFNVSIVYSCPLKPNRCLKRINKERQTQIQV